jgi:hypothetical protein
MMLAAFVALGPGCGHIEKPSADARAGEPMDGSAPGDASSGTLDAIADALPADAAPIAIALVTGDTTAEFGGGVSEWAIDLCPTGAALIAFSGSTAPLGTVGAFVSEVQGRCGAIHVGTAVTGGYATTATPGVLLAVRGTATSTTWTLSCPSDQFVVGLSGRFGSAIDQLVLQCAAVSLVAGDTGWTGQIGAITLTDAQGGSGGNANARPCTAGQIATSAHIWGPSDKSAVFGLGLGCSIVTAP